MTHKYKRLKIILPQIALQTHTYRYTYIHKQDIIVIAQRSLTENVLKRLPFLQCEGRSDLYLYIHTGS